MVQLSVLLSCAAIFSTTLASALLPPAPTPPPSLAKRASCTFSGSTGAAAASKSKTSCATIVLNNVAVPSGVTLDLTGLTSGTQVIFQGTTTFGYKEWVGPLISVSGTNIAVSGASGNVIDGGGSRWWDGKGGNGGKTKPKFFFAHSLTTSSIVGLNFKNSPVQLMSINGVKTLAVTNINFDNSAGDTGGGHNTDAFDVGSSSGVTITGAVVKNQDDCLAINSGTNIVFTGGSCSGGHGLSIGSVGGRTDNTVSQVTISSSTISNSQNGLRIKAVSGATGQISGITWSNIKLSNISKYGIVIEQDYENGSPTGTPTAGVPITGLSVSGVTGSVTSSANPIYILCAKGACSGWKWSGVSISGGKASTKCSNVPSPASC